MSARLAAGRGERTLECRPGRLLQRLPVVVRRRPVRSGVEPVGGHDVQRGAGQPREHHAELDGLGLQPLGMSTDDDGHRHFQSLLFKVRKGLSVTPILQPWGCRAFGADRPLAL